MNDYEKIMEKIKRDQRCRPKNCPGPTGPTGPQGPTGMQGESISVRGKYDTYDEFIQKHPIGNTDDSYLVNGDLYLWMPEKHDWENVGRIEGPQGVKGDKGAKGDKGDKGDAGPTLLRTAYLVTFNGGLDLEAPKNTNLPITREELDLTNLVTLNTTDNTIKFNEVGYYKITFIASAYTKQNGAAFNPDTDFVTIGFRQKDTDLIYIGASKWVQDEVATQITGHGMISVTNPNDLYEFTNLSSKTIYLSSPDLKNIVSASYFTNSLLTIIIEYLGRQTI